MADTRPLDFDNPTQMPSGNLLAGFPDYGAELPEERLPTGRHVFPTPGTPGMVEQFENGRAAKGVEIAMNRQVTGILRNDEGEVVGLELRYGHIAELARARKGVIFASGGFAHNEELVRRYIPGRIYGTCATLGAQGDFVRLGADAGAKLANMNNAWLKQVPLTAALRSPTPPSVWLPWGDAMIHVNKYGRRVVDEKMPYHDRSKAHSVYDPTKREYPNLALFMIYDDTVASSESLAGMRQPMPRPGESAEFVIRGDDWDDLIAKVDAELAAVAEAHRWPASRRCLQGEPRGHHRAVQRIRGHRRRPRLRSWCGADRTGLERAEPRRAHPTRPWLRSPTRARTTA